MAGRGVVVGNSNGAYPDGWYAPKFFGKGFNGNSISRVINNQATGSVESARVGMGIKL